MNIEKIKSLYIELEKYLKQYGNNSILPSYKIVKSTVELLSSNENDEVKKQIAVASYKKLFPGKGALSDFFVWDNDYETRKKINKPFEKTHNMLWELLKDEIH